MQNFHLSHVPAEAHVNCPLTRDVEKRIHSVASKYGSPQGLEEEMRTIYMLERQLEFIDDEFNPTHSFGFAERAAAHFEISKVESVALHNIEAIFAKEGKNESERAKIAKNISKLMVALAWEDGL